MGPTHVGVPAAGAPAPTFTLPDQDGQPFALADLRGASAVLLVFFPFAFSRTCTGELGALRDHDDRFAAADVLVAGVSCDPRPALAAWAAQEELSFPLLSDFWPHGEVARRYGVLDDDRGFAVRGSFLVDRHGVLRWSLVHGPGEARPVGSHLDALTTLRRD